MVPPAAPGVQIVTPSVSSGGNVFVPPTAVTPSIRPTNDVGLPFTEISPTIGLALPTGSGSGLIPTAGAGAQADAQAAVAAEPTSAWIAAPVVGSVAAVMVLGVMFMLLRRKRRGGNGGKSSGAMLNGLLAWLPFGGGTKKSGASGDQSPIKKYFGNHWRTGQRLADEESRASSRRGSISGERDGRPRPGSARPGTSHSGKHVQILVAEVRESKDRSVLRDSMNGLGQNKP